MSSMCQDLRNSAYFYKHLSCRSAVIPYQLPQSRTRPFIHLQPTDRQLLCAQIVLRVRRVQEKVEQTTYHNLLTVQPVFETSTISEGLSLYDRSNRYRCQKEHSNIERCHYTHHIPTKEGVKLSRTCRQFEQCAAFLQHTMLVSLINDMISCENFEKELFSINKCHTYIVK